MGTIIQRLRDGQLVRVMHFTGLSSPKLVEVVGILGNFHGLWIDQEHSAVPHSKLELMLMASRAVGLDAFSRVPPTDYATIMRPYEAGCSGVMVAQLRTLAEVKQVVSWAKIRRAACGACSRATPKAPRQRRDACAHRGCQPRPVAGDPNRDGRAVECIDQIAAEDGVDHLFVGPADLSVSLGVPGEYMNPKCIAALKRVAAASKQAGKSWGTLREMSSMPASAVNWAASSSAFSAIWTASAPASIHWNSNSKMS